MKKGTGTKILIQKECANHQTSGPLGMRDYCWMREKSNGGTCVFSSNEDNPQCEYFKKLIIPLEGK